MRSPKEFADGSIPGAINIPLFSDAERAEIGTIYCHDSPDNAKMRGLSLVAPKLPAMVAKIKRLTESRRPVVVYCWRGGMRSKSITSVLELMDIEAYQLEGGYKAFRHYVLDRLSSFPFKPIVYVLCGSTGVGKTAVLRKLQARGLPVLDLERLANHRGSIFGPIGLGRPQTSKNFDALLLQELERLNQSDYLLVECESKRIGNSYLPDFLLQAIKKGPKILLYTDIETRVGRLLEEYLPASGRDLTPFHEAIAGLQHKLGKKKVAALQRQLAEGQCHDVVKELLTAYYDPLYKYERIDPSAYILMVDATDLNQAVETIFTFFRNLQGGLLFCRM